LEEARTALLGRVTTRGDFFQTFLATVLRARTRWYASTALLTRLWRRKYSASFET
jgi:hypothetical protein